MVSNPYAAPETAVAQEATERSSARRKVVLASGWFAAAAMVFIAAVCAGMADMSRSCTTLFAVAAIVSAVGTVRAVLALIAVFRAPGASTGLVTGSIYVTLFNLGMVAIGASAALLSTMSFSRGRQLRRWGRIMLPPLARGSEWAKTEARLPVDDAVRGELAAQWRRNGLTEHASVAAFARLTLDLMGLGAPPSLIAAAQHDALDEIAHAETCFALARAIDGDASGPGVFPEAARARTLPSQRTLALSLLAVDSLVDGALHEGLSARIVAQLARRCELPTMTDALRRIAADEGRHSAHGWDVVEWCVAEGGEPVKHALLGALRTLPETMQTPLPEQASSGAWERWGIHGHALEGEQYARALEHVRARVLELTRSSRARPVDAGRLEVGRM